MEEKSTLKVVLSIVGFAIACLLAVGAYQVYRSVLDNHRLGFSPIVVMDEASGTDIHLRNVSQDDAKKLIKALQWQDALNVEALPYFELGRETRGLVLAVPSRHGRWSDVLMRGRAVFLANIASAYFQAPVQAKLKMPFPLIERSAEIDRGEEELLWLQPTQGRLSDQALRAKLVSHLRFYERAFLQAEDEGVITLGGVPTPLIFGNNGIGFSDESQWPLTWTLLIPVEDQRYEAMRLLRGSLKKVEWGKDMDPDKGVFVVHAKALADWALALEQLDR